MQWDDSVDVLVVGSGNGGLTAAVCLHEMGAGEVLTIEKGARFGGTSAYSGGGIWIPNNHYAQAAGAQDSMAEARDYLRHALPADTDPALVDAYLSNAPRMLKFLHERAAVRYVSLAHYPDYFSNLPGAKAGHRSLEPEPVYLDRLGDEAAFLMPTHPMISIGKRIGFGQVEAHTLVGQLPGWCRLAARLVWNYLTDFPWRLTTLRDRRACCGSAGIAQLRQAMMQRGMPLWRNTRLLELVRRDGRVVGAVVAREGKTLAIQARRGVVLAAGGFEHNQAMRETHLPHPTSTRWSAGAITNEGEAMRAGRAVGAQLKKMDSAWWVTTLCVPGENIPRPAIMEKSYPGSCVVNRLGRRIANESQNYMTYMQEALAKNSAAAPSSPAYMIFDARFRERYIVGPLLTAKLRPDWLLPRAWRKAGLFGRADSFDALARQMGIDPAGLQDTIAAFNGYARTGVDLEFGRGEALYDRYYGDPAVRPNPCLAPIVQPPFYAVRLELGDWGTQGGFATDVHARVLDDDHVPITGLYATGNCAAALLTTYPGPGSTLGPAMTCAYQAAKHISGHIEQEQPTAALTEAV